VYLKLAGDIERQLREAYHSRFESGQETQSSLAKKLGVDRSAVNRRLVGRTNMTIETIADMVWALEHEIAVDISDPSVQVRTLSNSASRTAVSSNSVSDFGPMFTAGGVS
jgi:hypothetical protein